MKIILFFLLSAYSTYGQVTNLQEKKFIVKDSLTNEILPFSNIDFGNGYGLFADNEGKVKLKINCSDIIKITHIGYENKIIKLQNIKDEVYLKPNYINLDEIKITSIKRKKILTNIKPLIHNDIYKMVWSAIAQQYAFLISYDNPNSFLKTITIPIIEKDFNQITREGAFKKQDFKTMLRIELYSNDGGIPKQKLNDFEQIAIIDSKKIKKKFELLLKEQIEIPKGGFFIVYTILGRVDENENYISEIPYDENYVNGTKKKFLKLILPDYPLVEDPQGVLTFFRYQFSENNNWERIKKPMIYSKNKDYPFFNIGFGYSIIQYN
jgi:hypothetical protein